MNTVEYRHDQHAHREEEVSMRFEMVAELIKRAGSGTILDIGCGLGEMYHYLKANHIGCTFYGTDFADSAIARCKEKYPDAQWSAALIGELPFDDGKFDIVVSCEVLEHMEDPALLMKDMARLVKPGGTIILTTPYLNQIPSQEHLWAFEEHDITNFFKEGYTVKFVRIFPTLIIANITKHA